MKYLVAICLALSLAGFKCASPAPPSPVPPAPTPPAPDAGPPPTGDVYDQACANLRRLSCPEGIAVNCAAVLRHADAEQIVDVNPGCIASCTDATCVRSCCAAIQCEPVALAPPKDPCAPAAKCASDGGCDPGYLCDGVCCLPNGDPT